MWKNHTTWTKSILPLLQLLISPFHLKYTFLFSHQHSHDQCSLDSLVPLIQYVISSWNISPLSILSYHLVDNVSCSRSFFYLSPIGISSSSLFISQSTPTFLNPPSWVSPTFNTTHYSHFTTTNLINTYPIATFSLLFFHPKVKAFVRRQPDDNPIISNSVVDPLHPIPEPS